MSKSIVMRTITGAVAASWLLTAGCVASVPVKIIPTVGLSSYPPTDPVSVTVLPVSPVRTHETLGQVVLEPVHPLSDAEINRLLRDAAGSMGAHAVVILANMNMQAGADWLQTSGGHIISAVAIRYTE